MKLIYKHENRAILYSVKNILALNGIESYVKNEYGNTMGPELGLSNTLLELWLPDAQNYNSAVSLIEAQEVNAEDAPDWICQSCGEKNAGNFGACWQCQNEPDNL